MSSRFENKIDLTKKKLPGVSLKDYRWRINSTHVFDLFDNFSVKRKKTMKHSQYSAQYRVVGAVNCLPSS